jgi:serine/threonine protein kinase
LRESLVDVTRYDMCDWRRLTMPQPSSTITADQDPKTSPTDPAAGAEAVDGSPRVLPLVEVPLDYYDVLAEHGRGGIGVVRRARDRRLDREVVIKELQRDSPEARRRFEREMRLTARLQHPGVVPVHECGRWPDGSPFYVMKLVEGRSLKELIAACVTLDERLGLVPHVTAVADAIAYAHAKRIIHRDLKPSNVIVGAFGETIVIDWGLAKDLDDEDDDLVPDALQGRSGDGSGELTASGQVMGTPAFMPPEQAEGGDVDERADVYALGAILYTLLTGETPYPGASPSETITRLKRQPPRPLLERAPSVPATLDAIVTRAMARAPEARYATARELADDLHRYQPGQMVGAHHYDSFAPLRRWLEGPGRKVGAIAEAALAAYKHGHKKK